MISATMRGWIIPMAEGRPRLTDEEMRFVKAQAQAYLAGRWVVCLVYRGVAALGVIAGTAAAVWGLLVLARGRFG